ncbi:MAG: substrate-binding domain-containing protein, partial [SAR324 cluster bacterium]|nr:substrate-binding domain-containing protein [SAR324 cluster bacterium]
HTAVAAAVSQGRADWGVAIQSVAEDQGLRFHFLQDEEYDFLLPESRMERPSVQAFLALLDQSEVQVGLRGLGLECS